MVYVALVFVGGLVAVLLLFRVLTRGALPATNPVERTASGSIIHFNMERMQQAVKDRGENNSGYGDKGKRAQ